MIFRRLFYSILILIGVITGFYLFQDKRTGKGVDVKTRYEIVPDWPKLPEGFKLGNPTGIGVNKKQNIFIFHRAGRKWPLIGSMPRTYIKEKTILEIDSENGQMLNSWGENMFIMPHGLTVDRDDNIWVTDVGLHQVFKFDHTGKLLMKLGEALTRGSDRTHFNRPTDVAVNSDGSFYVSDGYGNSRIVKFTSQGEYIFEWGKKGNEPGAFNIPHGICIDADENVYVADRENNRVQKFDPTGKLLHIFNDRSFASLCSVAIDSVGNKLVAIDDLTFLKVKHRGSDIFKIDTNGVIQTRFGRSGLYSGSTCWYHDVAVDNQQSIYVTDILKNRIQKFRQIKKAND